MTIFSRYLYGFSKYLLIFLMGVLSILVLAQVLSRNIPGLSISWSEEISRYLLVWLTFIGATVALRDNELVGLDLIQEKLNVRLQEVVKLIIHVLVLLFLLTGVYYGFQVATSYGITNRTLNTMNVSMSYVYIVFPLSMLIMVVHILTAITTNIKRIKEKTK